MHVLDLALERDDALVLGGLAVGLLSLDDETVLVSNDLLDGAGAGAGCGALGVGTGVAASSKTESGGTSSSGTDETTAGNGGVKLVFQVHEYSPFAPASHPESRAPFFPLRGLRSLSSPKNHASHLIVLNSPCFSVYDALT